MTTETTGRDTPSVRKYLRRNRGFITFLALMFIFRSAVADWNEVPTGSMNPTIIEGDRILINKAAYDIRVPFTHISLYKTSDPARGDIVVFDSDVSDKRLVKRVVGIPGDVVQLVNNVLYVNGERLAYKYISSTSLTEDRIEDLVGVMHEIRVKKTGAGLSSFHPVKVPAGQYLVLGDNRDDSTDSRVIGFIPRGEIIGRSRRVVLSLDYDHFYLPRPDRILKAI